MVDPQGQVLSVLQAIHQHNNIEGRPKGIRQILLSGFFPLRGYPPPPLTENRRKFCHKMVQIGLKIDNLVQKYPFFS